MTEVQNRGKRSLRLRKIGANEQSLKNGGKRAISLQGQLHKRPFLVWFLALPLGPWASNADVMLTSAEFYKIKIKREFISK